MDAFVALDASTALLRRQLAAVAPDQWDEPSACEGWSVRQVADHVLGGGYRYRLWLTGAPRAEVEASRAWDFVGTDAVAALDEHAASLRAALAEPGALERPVAHVAGEIPGRGLLELRVLEQTLHAWDIAVGIDGDRTIDPDLCAFLLAAASTVDRLREQGYYAPAAPGAPDHGAAPQERLLRLTGRWR
ncbi:TIGR03086 family metal-binding protein [Nocardioides sp. R1-1]|uniref:TIGR03086 family metal-binding protein n=1 Tax=Nocardioides sp. R1-1 TaxID=3383502 RepID=UPI0038CF952D